MRRRVAPPALSVGDTTYEGPEQQHRVRNNLASRLLTSILAIAALSPDHNVVLCSAQAPDSAGMSTASPSIFGNPGTYANGNIIDSGGAKSEFVNFNPATLTYNVMLKAGAQAIGAGTRPERRRPSTSSASPARLPTLREPIRTHIEHKLQCPVPGSIGSLLEPTRPGFAYFCGFVLTGGDGLPDSENPPIKTRARFTSDRMSMRQSSEKR